jgi:ribosomal protein S27AE
MAELTGGDKTIDRRGFLRGSALLAAAAVGVTVARPVFAGQQEPGKTTDPADEKKKQEEKEKEKEGEKKPEDQAGSQAKKETPTTGEQAKNDPNRLVDKDGREYRVCERCGGNMYKEGNTWTCEQCGFTYVE